MSDMLPKALASASGPLHTSFDELRNTDRIEPERQGFSCSATRPGTSCRLTRLQCSVHGGKIIEHSSSGSPS